MFVDHVNILRRSCLKLAKSTEFFRSGTMTKADSPELKATPDAGIAVATDGEQGPKNCSDGPSQIKSMQPPSFTSSTPLQMTASATESRFLYPAAIVGTAMMPRGEIGFLIAALVESTAIFVF